MRRRRLPPVLRERDFSLYWRAIVATGFAGQMMAVAVGWQVYAINESALDLGLIGLAQFLPLPLLALPAGHIADRLPRRLVYAAAIGVDILIAAACSSSPSRARARCGPSSCSRWPPGAPPPSAGPPPARCRRRSCLRTCSQARWPCAESRFRARPSSAPPSAGCSSPRTGGEVVYASRRCSSSLALVNVVRVTERTEERLPQAMSREALFAGARFVRRTPVLFGAISLDLFAVLFGGAVALLPLFAKSILDVGPVGLGILRSAPAVGALVAGIILAHRPIRGNAGRTLFIVVAVFGASHIVFGLSKSFPLSCAALAVAGFADMFSMNIRSMTVALATPDELRGRVNAVEMVFISGSNELGAFESGIAAALIGAVPAVVLGGVATIGIAVIWARLFPDLRDVDRLELYARPRIRNVTRVMRHSGAVV